MSWIKNIFKKKDQVEIKVEDKVEPVNRFSKESLSRIKSGLELISSKNDKQIEISSNNNRPTFYAHPTKDIFSMKGERYSFNQNSGLIYKLNVLDSSSLNSIDVEELGMYRSKVINGKELMFKDSNKKYGEFNQLDVISTKEFEKLKNKKINEMYGLIQEVFNSLGKDAEKETLEEFGNKLEKFYQSSDLLNLEKDEIRQISKAQARIGYLMDSRNLESSLK